jgi:hypothetical protein
MIKILKTLRMAVLTMAVLSLGACIKPSDTGSIVETETTITITNNGGGTLAAFIDKRSELEASGKIIVLEGYCASACTIFYSLPKACMAKGSSLHFHGAAALVGVVETIANAKIARYYRAGIKAGFVAEWYKLTKPMHELKREAAIALDPLIRRCENG